MLHATLGSSRKPMWVRVAFASIFLSGSLVLPAAAQIAVRGELMYTMTDQPIDDGVVIIRDGKIAAVGPASRTPIPAGMQVVSGAVVTPGLIDAHCVVGMSGILNIAQDQEQLEHSSPIQPELRAIDGYNPLDPLIEWVRDFGVTTVHTGHAPGELISGQTMIVKTYGQTVEQALVKSPATIAATLGTAALKGDKSPGTRGKEMAMLREEFIKASEYAKKMQTAEPDKKPDRDLRLEVLADVLAGKIPMMITAHRSQDIASALRLAKEFKFRLILDGASESYLLIDKIRRAQVPVIVHPSMQRAIGECENMSFETAAKLRHERIRVAIQGGYESYVPKVRVVLFEAAGAAANGMTTTEALEAVTSDAAVILGIDDRVGSLDVGKDGDVAVYDGDPFEYTTHCTAVVINGELVSNEPH